MPAHTSDARQGAWRVTYRPSTAAAGLSCWLAVPRVAAEGAAPIVAVHGVGRGAQEQVQRLAPRAAQRGHVVIAPVFDAAHWKRYQQVVTRCRADLGLISLLARLEAEGVIRGQRCILSGFSGGAQFAHRFAMLHPRRVERVVAASAGWYTFPDDAPFPYGTGRVGEHGAWGEHVARQLNQFLRVPVTVCVGEHDGARDATTRTGADIDVQQGADRITRGRHWTEAVADAARTRGLAPQVSFMTLPGCGHEFSQCVREGGLDAIIVDRVRPDYPAGRSGLGTAQRISANSGESQVAGAKWSFCASTIEPSRPEALTGDLLVCRVEAAGAGKALQLAPGRTACLYESDHAVLVQDDARDAANGAGTGAGDAPLLTLASSSDLVRTSKPIAAPPTDAPLGATLSRPLGALRDACGHALNGAGVALGPARLPVVLMMGTTGNCGRTTAAANLLHGLARAALRVAVPKAIGRASVVHPHAHQGAGADLVADILHLGAPSPHGLATHQVTQHFDTLLAHASCRGCHVAIMELADVLLYAHTQALLRREREADHPALVVLAAGDAAAAESGCGRLRGLRLRPAALCSALVNAPQSAREAAAATGLRVMRPIDLRDPNEARALVRPLPHGTRAPRPAAAAATETGPVLS